jgi:uncharacterized membrane protein
MTKGRLEAFSDGVFAILITILVLELKTPHGHEWAALRPLLPVFLSYVLSFVFLGIYWNNHHHLLQAAGRINGRILWANLHLMFWLSLIPFVTGWMGDHASAPLPTALYGVAMVMAAIAYTILQVHIVRADGEQSRLRQAIGKDWKGKVSLALYLASIPLAFARPLLSQTFFVIVALIWLVPDRRIERHLHASH